MAALRVVILADDLIWADRLARAVEGASGEPTTIRSMPAFAATLADADGAPDAAIVDLTARAYDGLAAIGAARDAGIRVLAVGQHDDHALRKAALAAGAERVLAYQKLFADGPATIAAFLGAPAHAPAPGSR